MLRKFVDDRRFAFADLILVLICGAIGIIKPELAFWFLPIALLPWLLRSFGERFPFKRTVFDGPLFVFLITAGVGNLVAYNKVAAANKFFFILIAILLYYALCNQPQTNFAGVAVLFFVIGFGIVLYYFLTRNFLNNPTDISVINNLERWFMKVRPELGWSPIPAGYVPGLAIITTSFASFWFVRSQKTLGGLLRLIVIICFAIVLLAILSTGSTSVWVALLSSAGVWVLWRIFVENKPGNYHWFPWLVLGYLVPVTVFACVLDPAASASPNDFGMNSRPEIFTRAVHFVRDFPISGAGLVSFPGLYSEYMLGIPYFYISNSYNLFLDVTVEQGLLGGVVFLFIYLRSISQLTGKLQETLTRTQRGLALFVLLFSFIHALMQDYLYNAAGTILLLFPVGMSVVVSCEASIHTVAATPMFRIPSNKRILLATTFVMFVLIGVLLNVNKLMSVWYSNLGAVQLEQVELAHFPESGWLGVGVIPKLHDAETSLHSSLRLNPNNLTANHRLGLIYMLYRDFDSASKYLETAYAGAPNHRGIKKSLGYSYLWMGDVDKAQEFLAQLPEIDGEMDAYYWWWSNQDRADLSKNAFILLRGLDSSLGQP